jgi:hypothetical protein
MIAALTITPVAFDYSAIDANLAFNLRRQANRIRTRIGTATQDLIDIGRDLLAAKKHLIGRGDFIKWVEAEVGIARRTAQAYMAIAKLADDKGAAIALLPPTTVHRLASKSAPPEVVSEVVAKAQSGDVLPDRMVSEMILGAKFQRKKTARHEGNGLPQSKQSKIESEAKEQARPKGEQARPNREKKTSEAVEALLKALGYDGVVLVVKMFSEQESPFDLISALRRQSHPASAGRCTERPRVETEAVATAQIPAPPEVKADAGVSLVAHNELDEQEIERRRNLVRTLFNDFWSGAYEKPAAFVERLDQAKDYVNERLAEAGEFWQLDTKTRAMLGLPSRANSPNNGKNRAVLG